MKIAKIPVHCFQFLVSKLLLMIVILISLSTTLRSQEQKIDQDLVQNLLKAQRYREVLNYLTPWAISETTDSSVLFTIGFSHYMLNNFGNAEIYFQKILAEYPDNISANEYLKNIYLLVNPDEANTYLHKLVSLRPETGSNYRDLGDLFSKRNNKDSAFSNYQAAYRSDSNDYKSVARFVSVLIDQKQFKS